MGLKFLQFRVVISSGEISLLNSRLLLVMTVLRREPPFKGMHISISGPLKTAVAGVTLSPESLAITSVFPSLLSAKQMELFPRCTPKHDVIFQLVNRC